ncbi:MAG: hypothetical protein ACK5H0_10450 [Bacteroidota bacterium]|jgi:hypothetical protein
MSTFDLGTGISAINTILAEEANRIGQDIYKRTLHTSPWMDLIKQSAFPEGMGYQLTTLVYDRTIPATATSGSGVQGVTWSALGTLNASNNSFSTSQLDQPLKDAADDVQGGRGTGASDKRSYVQFSKQLKNYSISRAVIESPRISLEDLRFAAHRQEQLRAILDLLTESSRYTWENRYRDEYEKTAANLVPCLASGTPIVTVIDQSVGTLFEGKQIAEVDLTNDFVSSGSSDDYTPTANISNKILDTLYFQLVRKGAAAESYGKENGRPVFAVVLSSEASYALQTEAGFRDDVRYNNAKVSELIAPLGVEKSFRGFYHLVDDLAPRFTIASGAVTRVQPYTVSNGITSYNPAYDTADYEAAYIIHPHVMESQIPNPMSGSNGLTFNPVNYRGDFKWTNILNEITNPDGTTGFFRGILASATKPIKTDFGYAILFKRTAATPAA